MSLTPRPPSAPESIVTDLEHARMLKEAGWPQETGIFYWIECDRNSFTNDEQFKLRRLDARPLPCDLAAPTAEEILRRLPPSFQNQFDRTGILNIDLCDGIWGVCYLDHESKAWWIDGREMVMGCSKDSLANAAAAMYCYLAKNGLLPKEA